LSAAFPGIYITKIHVSEFTAAGTPDLLACIRGRFVALEVKMPGEAPTELQTYTLERIRAAGGFAATVSSPQQAVALIENLLHVKA
jgi:hypothetical protein